MRSKKALIFGLAFLGLLALGASSALPAVSRIALGSAGVTDFSWQRIRPLAVPPGVRLTGLEAKLPQGALRADSLELRLDPSSLFKGPPLIGILSGLEADLDFSSRASKAHAPPDTRTAGIRPGRLPFRSFEVRALKVGARGPGWRIHGAGDLLWDGRRLALLPVRFRIHALQVGDLQMASALFQKTSQEGGTFEWTGLQWRKIKDLRISGLWEARPGGLALSLSPLERWGGRVEGEAEVEFFEDLRYLLTVRAEAVSAEEICKMFETQNRALLKGFYSGRLEAAGTSRALSRVEGSLSSSVSGGEILLRDPAWFETLAQKTGQSPEIIRAELEQYRFEQSTFALRQEDGQIRLVFSASGPMGKRDFDIRYHLTPSNDKETP